MASSGSRVAAPLAGTGGGTKVLVVDDEPHITEVLSTTLRFAGFQVCVAATGGEAVEIVRTEEPAIVVLDVGLPDTDGFALCRRLRSMGNLVPILFLTARDGVADRVAGLGFGADDYITKPFAISEVIARIQAVLRRVNAEPRPAPVLQVADLELDEEAHEVRRAGRLVELSPTEFRLLRYLMVNHGRVLTKARIRDQVWDYDFGGGIAVVEKAISQLRSKVDCIASEPRLLRTVRGVGYVLSAPR